MATKIPHFDINDVWQQQKTFLLNGVPTDPTNLTVRQQDASGVETTLVNNVLVSTLNGSSTPVAKTSTGVFKLNPGISISASGYWFCRFEGTGAVVEAEEFQAIGDPSQFTVDAGISPRALLTLQEVKDWLNQQNIVYTEDLDFVRVINDISDRFHQESGREFKPIQTGSQARTYPASCQAVEDKFLVVDDLTSFSQVRILDRDWTTLIENVALSKITAHPMVREAWQPIRKLQFRFDVTPIQEWMRIEVTGTWGFPAIPGTVRQAALDAVAWIIDREVEHYSDELSATPTGSENVVLLQGGQQRTVDLPPTALAAAQGFREDYLG